MYSNMKSILQEIFPSAEMASYLAKCPISDDIDCSRDNGLDGAPPEKLPLYRYQIEDAVSGALIPLKRKREIFLLLAEGEEDGYFSTLADAASRAIQKMQMEPGEFFFLKGYYSGGASHFREYALDPYLSWENIFACIREFLGDLEGGKEELTYFVAEKWSPDGKGNLKNDYNYTLVGSDVCYFECNGLFDPDQIEFAGGGDLNLPVPFRAGDIVTIDCRPFAPVSHAVSVEVGDNADCCCLQALFRESGGTWDTGAVKHGQIFPDYGYSQLSPLYRLSSFHGQLSEEESLLQKVSGYVNGDEGRGAALWDFICHLRGKGRRNGKVTEEQILSYIDKINRES